MPTDEQPTPDRLGEIRVRADAATPGPWLHETSLTMDDSVHYAIRTRDPMPEHPWSPRFVAWMTGLLLPYVRPSNRPKGAYCDSCRHMCYRGREVAIDVRQDTETEADASFLASAREDVPWLLAEIDRLSAETSGLRHQLDWERHKRQQVEADREVILTAVRAFVEHHDAASEVEDTAEANAWRVEWGRRLAALRALVMEPDRAE